MINIELVYPKSIIYTDSVDVRFKIITDSYKYESLSVSVVVMDIDGNLVYENTIIPSSKYIDFSLNNLVESTYTFTVTVRHQNKIVSLFDDKITLIFGVDKKPNTKLSLMFKKNLPQFVKDEYPLFIDFIQTYFEWLESSNNPYFVPFVQQNYTDINKTPELFLKYLREMYLSDFPENIKTSDKRLAYKQIRSFYANKGNKSALKYFFKILYGINADTYDPKELIFRPSYSKWTQTTSIKIPFVFGIENIKGKYAFEPNSTFSAIIDKVNVYMAGPFKVAELFLSNISGTLIGNKIKIDYKDYTIYPIVTNIDIEYGGANYAVGDTVTLGLSVDEPDAKGYGYFGVVETVDEKGAITKIKTINCGVHYDTTKFSIPGDSYDIHIRTNAGVLFQGTVVTDLICYIDGYYSSLESHPSGSTKLQDNKKYQELSYVIKCEKVLSRYIDLLRKLVHPAGMAVFGDVSIQEVLDVLVSLSSDYDAYYVPQIGNYLPYRFYSTQNLREVDFTQDDTESSFVETDEYVIVEFDMFFPRYNIPSSGTGTQQEIQHYTAYLSEIYGPSISVAENFEVGISSKDFVLNYYGFWSPNVSGQFIPSGYTWKGTFNENATYQLNDLVKFIHDGYEAVYVCVQPTPKLTTGKTVAPDSINFSVDTGKQYKFALGSFWDTKDICAKIKIYGDTLTYGNDATFVYGYPEIISYTNNVIEKIIRVNGLSDYQPTEEEPLCDEFISNVYGDIAGLWSDFCWWYENVAMISSDPSVIFAETETTDAEFKLSQYLDLVNSLINSTPEPAKSDLYVNSYGDYLLWKKITPKLSSDFARYYLERVKSNFDSSVDISTKVGFFDFDVKIKTKLSDIDFSKNEDVQSDFLDVYPLANSSYFVGAIGSFLKSYWQPKKILELAENQRILNWKSLGGIYQLYYNDVDNILQTVAIDPDDPLVTTYKIRSIEYVKSTNVVRVEFANVSDAKSFIGSQNKFIGKYITVEFLSAGPGTYQQIGFKHYVVYDNFKYDLFSLANTRASISFGSSALVDEYNINISNLELNNISGIYSTSGSLLSEINRYVLLRNKELLDGLDVSSAKNIRVVGDYLPLYSRQFREPDSIAGYPVNQHDAYATGNSYDHLSYISQYQTSTQNILTEYSELFTDDVYVHIPVHAMTDFGYAMYAPKELATVLCKQWIGVADICFVNKLTSTNIDSAFTDDNSEIAELVRRGLEWMFFGGKTIKLENWLDPYYNWYENETIVGIGLDFINSNYWQQATSPIGMKLAIKEACSNWLAAALEEVRTYTIDASLIEMYADSDKAIPSFEFGYDVSLDIVEGTSITTDDDSSDYYDGLGGRKMYTIYQSYDPTSYTQTSPRYGTISVENIVEQISSYIGEDTDASETYAYFLLDFQTPFIDRLVLPITSEEYKKSFLYTSEEIESKFGLRDRHSIKSALIELKQLYPNAKFGFIGIPSFNTDDYYDVISKCTQVLSYFDFVAYYAKQKYDDGYFDATRIKERNDSLQDRKIRMTNQILRDIDSKIPVFAIVDVLYEPGVDRFAGQPSYSMISNYQLLRDHRKQVELADKLVIQTSIQNYAEYALSFNPDRPEYKDYLFSAQFRVDSFGNAEADSFNIGSYSGIEKIEYVDGKFTLHFSNKSLANNFTRQWFYISAINSFDYYGKHALIINQNLNDTTLEVDLQFSFNVDSIQTVYLMFRKNETKKLLDIRDAIEIDYPELFTTGSDWSSLQIEDLVSVMEPKIRQKISLLINAIGTDDAYSPRIVVKGEIIKNDLSAIDNINGQSRANQTLKYNDADWIGHGSKEWIWQYRQTIYDDDVTTYSWISIPSTLNSVSYTPTILDVGKYIRVLEYTYNAYSGDSVASNESTGVYNGKGILITQ